MNITEALDYLDGVTFENYMGGGQITALKDGKPLYIVCEIGCACGEIATKNAEAYGDALVALLNGAKDAHERATRLAEAADLAIRGFRRWKRNQRRGGSRNEADHGLDDLGQAISDLDALLHPAPEEASAT